MTDAEIDALRRKAEALLKQAAETTDPRERARLVGLAADWHRQAVTAVSMARVTRNKTKPDSGK